MKIQALSGETAIAQRFRPCSVFGPVDLPPWNLHTCFPLLAGAIHCCFVRFDVAWHRGQRIRPLPRLNVAWAM